MNCRGVAGENLLNPIPGFKKAFMVVFLRSKYKTISINYYSYRNYILPELNNLLNQSHIIFTINFIYLKTNYINLK